MLLHYLVKYTRSTTANTPDVFNTMSKLKTNIEWNVSLWSTVYIRAAYSTHDSIEMLLKLSDIVDIYAQLQTWYASNMKCQMIWKMGKASIRSRSVISMLSARIVFLHSDKRQILVVSSVGLLSDARNSKPRPTPRAPLQGAATWRIYWSNRRAFVHLIWQFHDDRCISFHVMLLPYKVIQPTKKISCW